jgi:putative ATP-dependent endonuclease of the OLD family
MKSNMYLSNLKLWNFRKYGIDGTSFENSNPGLSVSFEPGVNVLIGENDSGKTTIIDAIRYVLHTQSGEYIQVDEKDFHEESGERTDQLRIECTFKGFSDKDAGNFLEWLGFEKNSEGETEYILKIWLYAKINDDRRIYQYFRAGADIEGSFMEGDARELLKVVYLKPLRDALSEMTHGNKSRLAQILKSHPVFKIQKDDNGKEKKHELEDDYKNLKTEIDDYFDPDKEKEGKEISNKINDLLNNFFTSNDSRTAKIQLTGNDLTDILKQLDLDLESNKSGLGSLNLLCIAAELLLFMENRQGLKLTLIEELEAHLHPQYQLRLINYINKESDFGQFILTTHSTTLASKINLEKLVICKGDNIYPMGHKYTELQESDYAFMERFLDATKANLFFAEGLIIVEGDAENLLIPTIANIIDRSLHKYGVSIVNVGSTAFKRYVNIFQRKDGQTFDMPVSIISDLDIRCLEYKESRKMTDENTIEAERIEKRSQIESQFNKDKIKIFLTKKWTLEYEIACSKIYKLLEQAIRIAKFEKSYPTKEITNDIFKQKKEEIDNEDEYNTLDSELSYKIFKPLCDGSVSKASTAQYLATILENGNNEKIDIEGKNIRTILETDEYLKYIVDAIYYVTKPKTESDDK